MSNLVEPKTLYLDEGPDVPNNPVLPVLIYRQVLGEDGDDMARGFEERFAENGWRGTWRNGIFSYHHFHPDAHEALGIACGSVEVQLGGERGKRLRLEAGDLVVLPAGTGHRNLSASDDLLVIGSYPAGQEDYTTSRTKTDRNAVAQVPLPQSDPFYGSEGPLPRVWNSPAEG